MDKLKATLTRIGGTLHDMSVEQKQTTKDLKSFREKAEMLENRSKTMEDHLVKLTGNFAGLSKFVEGLSDDLKDLKKRVAALEKKAS